MTEKLIDKLMQEVEKNLSLKDLKTEMGKGYWRGWTVAHEMAEKGYKFTNKEILRLADKDGWTVAHEMAFARGYKFTDKDVLRLATNGGWTVAHAMAWNNYIFTDKKILKMADKRGQTVAHEMAKQGYKFTDKEILELADENGKTVAHTMENSEYYFIDKNKEVTTIVKKFNEVAFKLNRKTEKRLGYKEGGKRW